VLNEAITVKARDAAEEAKETALETLHDVRERVDELRPRRRRRRARELPARRLVLVLGVALGAVGVIVWMKRRTQTQQYGPSSDAFGAAVLEEQRASNGGRETIATPGA
jgi:hypothetical protein